MAEEVSRRAVIGGMLASATVVNAEAAEDPYVRVRRDAERLAASMQAIHGGVWGVCVDHGTEFVLIKPRSTQDLRV